MAIIDFAERRGFSGDPIPMNGVDIQNVREGIDLLQDLAPHLNPFIQRYMMKHPIDTSRAADPVHAMRLILESVGIEDKDPGFAAVEGSAGKLGFYNRLIDIHSHLGKPLNIRIVDYIVKGTTQRGYLIIMSIPTEKGDNERVLRALHIEYPENFPSTRQPTITEFPLHHEVNDVLVAHPYGQFPTELLTTYAFRKMGGKKGLLPRLTIFRIDHAQPPDFGGSDNEVYGEELVTFGQRRAA